MVMVAGEHYEGKEYLNTNFVGFIFENSTFNSFNYFKVHVCGLKVD